HRDLIVGHQTGGGDGADRVLIEPVMEKAPHGYDPAPELEMPDFPRFCEADPRAVGVKQIAENDREDLAEDDSADERPIVSQIEGQRHGDHERQNLLVDPVSKFLRKIEFPAEKNGPDILEPDQ